MEIYFDWESLLQHGNGTKVILHPNEDNPLHDNPIEATLSDGYFFCEGSNPLDGPDYYFGDVAQYNEGFSYCDSLSPTPTDKEGAT